MRLYVGPTTGQFLLHVFYDPTRPNFRIIIGDSEQTPPVPEEGEAVTPQTLGHMTMLMTNFHGFFELKGSGKIYGIAFTFEELPPPEFYQTFRPEDAIELVDERRILQLSDLA